MKIARWILFVVLLSALVAIVNRYWFSRAVVVDVASVSRGTLIESINISGLSRATDYEMITAPTAGQLERITWRSGDEISKHSILATITPPPSSLLDPRSEKMAKSRVQAAESELRRAKLIRDAAEVSLKQVQKRKSNVVSPGTQIRPALPDLDAEEQARKLELDAAGHGVDRAQYELDAARAQLGTLKGESKPGDTANSTDDDEHPKSKEADDPLAENQRVELRSSMNGHVLRILKTDSGVVAPGTPLLEIGNLERLEFVFDVLTNEAVQLAIGTRVQIENWGHEEEPIPGRISRIDRSASRRLSPLGVEEHTVGVYVEATEKHPLPASLGHGYKVDGRFLIRETSDKLRVPLGALFRENGEWYAFRVQNGLAIKTQVQVGLRNDQDFSIISGLSDYDLVVLFPAHRVQNGQAVKLR
jgi:HlyD family secretion protein